MRKILFRGIPKDDTTRRFFADIWKDNCKGSFVYGSLIIDKGRYYICVSALCTINSCINNGMTSMIEVIPETVGQYTGWTDKNGKKIFEGDVVKACNATYDNGFAEVKGKVFFNCGSFDIDVEDVIYIPLYSYGTENIEVIDNIHDDGELLKGENKNDG